MSRAATIPLRVLVLVLLVAGGCLAASGPVAAGATGPAPPGGVELSADGVTWSDGLTTPLVDPALRWVPGQVETGVLYVRSSSCEGATGRAEVVLGAGGAGLARDLHVRTRVGDRAWVAGRTSEALTVGDDPVRLGVEIAFDPASGNASQRQTIPVDVVVTLACGVGTPPPQGAGTAQGDGGALAVTGPEVLRLVAAAAALALLGTLLLLRVRAGTTAGARRDGPGGGPRADRGGGPDHGPGADRGGGAEAGR